MKTDLRVTKYNPKFRDVSGKYLKNEWTAFSDVGKYFTGDLFLIEEYYSMENKYIKAVEYFFRLNNVDRVTVVGLEKYDIESKVLDETMQDVGEKVENSATFHVRDLSSLLKLILREYLWCELHSPDEAVKVKFGYDYYMYFYSKRANIYDELLNGISEIGLFVD
jgi:hypothetical protein